MSIRKAEDREIPIYENVYLAIDETKTVFETIRSEITAYDKNLEKMLDYIVKDEKQWCKMILNTIFMKLRHYLQSK